MADIQSNKTTEFSSISLLAGEYISIKVLNSDMTVKTTVLEKQVPSGKIFDGSAGYEGSLA